MCNVAQPSQIMSMDGRVQEIILARSLAILSKEHLGCTSRKLCAIKQLF